MSLLFLVSLLSLALLVLRSRCGGVAAPWSHWAPDFDTGSDADPDANGADNAADGLPLFLLPVVFLLLTK